MKVVIFLPGKQMWLMESCARFPPHALIDGSDRSIWQDLWLLHFTARDFCILSMSNESAGSGMEVLSWSCCVVSAWTWVSRMWLSSQFSFTLPTVQLVSAMSPAADEFTESNSEQKHKFFTLLFSFGNLNRKWLKFQEIKREIRLASRPCFSPKLTNSLLFFTLFCSVNGDCRPVFGSFQESTTNIHTFMFASLSLGKKLKINSWSKAAKLLISSFPLPGRTGTDRTPSTLAVASYEALGCESRIPCHFQWQIQTTGPDSTFILWITYTCRN